MNRNTCFHIALFFVGVFLYQSVSAQTLIPEVIASTGDYYANATGSLSWTLGEPIIETYSDGTNILTQGFQQTLYDVTAVDDIADPTVKISVYPNPFSSTFTIKSEGKNELYVEVIDVSGKIISKKSITNGETQMNLSSVSDAIYLLKVCTASGETIQTFKIEKAK